MPCMMILPHALACHAGKWISNHIFGVAITYSSRIQLDRDWPPKLIPLAMLAASESFLGLSPLDAFVEIGCAPVCATESRRPKTLLIAPLEGPSWISISPDALVSFPVVGRSALVEGVILDPFCAAGAKSIDSARLPMLLCWSTPSNKPKGWCS